MKIPAAQFKSLVKRLSAVNAAAIRLDAEQGLLAAADNDLSILVDAPPLRAQGWAVAVAAKQLSAICHRLSGEVEIEGGVSGLQIRAARASFELAAVTTPPAIPDLPAVAPVEIGLEALQPLLRYASSASAPSERFAYAGSVQLRVRASQSGRVLRAAGCDGKRLAVIDLLFSGEWDDLLIPVMLVKPLCDLPPGTVKIYPTESALHFVTDGGRLVVRKLAKDFPNFESYLPAKFLFQAKLATADMRAALDTVAPIASLGESKALRLDFRDRLRLSAAADGSNAADELGYTALLPDPMFDEPIPFSMALNHGYLSDFFSAVEGDVIFSANQPDEPAWLEAGARKLLLAPIRMAPQGGAPCVNRR